LLRGTPIVGTPASVRRRSGPLPPASRLALRRRAHGRVPPLPPARFRDRATARGLPPRRRLVRGLDARLLAPLCRLARRHARLARPAALRARAPRGVLQLAP